MFDEETNAWFPPFCCRSAVSPLPLRKFRRGLRITLLRLREKNPLCRCRCHLPLRRSNRIESYFLPFCELLPFVDNQSAFWSLHPYVYGKAFPAFPFSPATATVATERKNGKGMVETTHTHTHRVRVMAMAASQAYCSCRGVADGQVGLLTGPLFGQTEISFSCQSIYFTHGVRV